MAKWILVDGFNLAFRCFYAIPELTRRDGFPTNAVHGWMRGLWRLLDEEKPDGMAVFYDLGGSAFREALLPSYKANRAETPPTLLPQIPWLKDLGDALGLARVERAGIESDDLLASAARALAEAGHEVWIVSGDKDFAQLVDARVRLLQPPPSASPKSGWSRIDRAGVESKFGVPPERIADYLALVGDAVDNIPGIAGVGPKTAARWLLDHPGLEAIIAAASTLKPERFRTAVAESAEDLRRNRRLTQLDTSHEVPLPLGIRPDGARLLRLLEELEMSSHAKEARRRYEQAELF